MNIHVLYPFLLKWKSFQSICNLTTSTIYILLDMLQGHWCKFILCVIFFRGTMNPNLTVLRNILLTFVAFHPNIGYAQGMNDILAQFLVVFDSEVCSDILTFIFPTAILSVCLFLFCYFFFSESKIITWQKTS